MPWMDGFQMGWMWLTPIVFLVLVGLAVWMGLRSLGTGAGTSQTPEEILKTRYAKGEIDRDEYRQRLSDLKK
jgi:putative membrane protein